MPSRKIYIFDEYYAEHKYNGNNNMGKYAFKSISNVAIGLDDRRESVGNIRTLKLCGEGKWRSRNRLESRPILKFVVVVVVVVVLVVVLVVMVVVVLVVIVVLVVVVVAVVVVE